jgi:hypothetical protein
MSETIRNAQNNIRNQNQQTNDALKTTIEENIN